ncbi:low-density lipoprotein receptor domain containing lost and found isoform X2 [Oratosquilla oratoria]|uniref:low-density lipoprotein receptor domain containing lost and found isoform X2 n=1 Tax=Oratosquilla oratoria TaxID=337810 RepID=UPI003F776319
MDSQSPGEAVTARREGLKWFNLCVPLFLLACTCIPVASPAGNSAFAVSELCSDSFLKQHTRMIEGAVVTSLSERNLDCTVTFQTDSVLQRFMLRFERLQLDCNDHLFIYDGAYATNSYKADLSCHNTLQNVGTIYTRTNHVTLKYITDQWGPTTDGFKLLITAFKDKKHTCMNFRCKTTNFCIERDLTCDGVNHCGDGSDESTSLARCPSAPLGAILGLSGTLLVAVICAAALVCCACGVAIVVCVYRRNRSHLRQPQPPAYPNEYPPAYPMEVGGTYGTNGTFGTLLAEKPPHNYHHPGNNSLVTTSVYQPSSGNLDRPAREVGSSTLQLIARYCLLL